MEKVWMIMWIAGWPSQDIPIKTVSDIIVSSEAECRAIEARSPGILENGIVNQSRCYFKLVPKKKEEKK